MKQKTNSQAYAKLILWLLIFPLYYYSYRYIFQYSSPGTSATYSATPLVWQIGKYLIVAYILLGGMLYSFMHKFKRYSSYLNKTRFNLFVIVLLFTIYEIVKGFDQTVIFFTMPLVLCNFGICQSIDFQKIDRCLYIFFLYAIVYDLIQIVLFIFTGRLPALGWPNSINVRFGGPMDDPNGFGLLLSFFIPFLFYYTKNYRKQKFLLISGIIMLLLTQSFTGIGVFCFSMCTMYVLMAKGATKRVMRILKIAILFCILGFYVYMTIWSKSSVQDYMEMKQGSVEGHSDSYQDMMQISDFELLLGFSGIGGEADIVNYIGRLGIFFLLYILLFYINNIVKLYQISRISSEPFWKAALAYQISFVVSMFNLPVTAMFTTSMFSFTIILLTMVSPQHKKRIGIHKITNR